MSRIINTEGSRKERLQLSKNILLALRELIKHKEPNEESRDIVAYIILSLRALNQTIESSVLAWEKRGYWLKADRYRLEWEWAEEYSNSLYESLINNEWQIIALLIVKIGEKLGAIKVPKHNKLGTPWLGSVHILFSNNQSVSNQ